MKIYLSICLAFISSLFNGCFEQGDQELTMKLHVSQSANSEVNCAAETAEALRNRLDVFGVHSGDFNISVEGKSLSVQVKNLIDAERTARILATTGKLGFWETYENEEVFEYLAKTNDYLAMQSKARQPETEALQNEPEELPDLIQQMGGDTLEGDLSFDLSEEEFLLQNPLWAILSPAGGSSGLLYQGPVVGYAKIPDTAKINDILSMEPISSFFPHNLKLIWTNKPIDADDGGQTFQLIALKLTGGRLISAMDESDLATSEMTFNGYDDTPEITMRMTREGARDWAILTRNNVGRSIAITLDGKVFSFPTVQSEIVGGISSITGDFTEEEAQDLANILNSKSLPCEVKVLQKDIKVLN